MGNQRSTAIKAVTEFTQRPWWVHNKKCTFPQGRPPLHLLCPVVPGNIHQEQQEAPRAPLHYQRETSEALSGSGGKEGRHRQDTQWSCQAYSKELGGEVHTVNICVFFFFLTITVNILVIGVSKRPRIIYSNCRKMLACGSAASGKLRCHHIWACLPSPGPSKCGPPPTSRFVKK